MVWVMNHAPSIEFCPPFEKIKTNGKDLLPLHPNQQKFQIPKIEVLYNIYKPSKAIFWGWGFPYIALTYSLYRSFVPPFSGPEMFGDRPKMNYDDYIQKQPLVEAVKDDSAAHMDFFSYPKDIGPSKLAILRTLPLLYRFKPFHWRVQDP